MELTLGQLAREIGGELQNGNPDSSITGVATLQHAGPGDLSFLANTTYRKSLQATRASAVILAAEHAAECPTAAIVTANPYERRCTIFSRTAGGTFDPRPAVALECVQPVNVIPDSSSDDTN